MSTSVPFFALKSGQNGGSRILTVRDHSHSAANPYRLLTTNHRAGRVIESPQPLRRTLAIMAADVVDYTRLTELAEEETHYRLRALRVGMIDPCVVSYRGQVIKNTGDGFLATFDSSMDALRCALEVQRDVTENERPETPDRRIRLRLALNVGDVITEPDDI